LDGNPCAGLEACGSHERFPLGSVRPTPDAGQLINCDMCELVAKSFFEKLAILVEQLDGKPHDSLFDVGGPQTASKPRTELDRGALFESRTPPGVGPSRGSFLKRFRKLCCRLCHGRLA
jgi:hypothetical protein